MANKKIFIEYTRKTKLPIFDKKKQMIDNQKVIPKKKNNRKIPKRGADLTFSRRFGGNSLAYFIKTRKSSLLLICSFFMIVSSLSPLLIKLNNYYWEKGRILQNESDILYNIFLIEGIEGRSKWIGTDHRGEFVVPSLKMRTYRVQRGDSLFGLSHKFNISVDTILTANHLKNAQFLKIGTELKIPNKSGIFYSVKKGDNLSNIARKYNVSVNKIADINDLSSSVIQVGQSLFIPGGTLDSWDRAALIGTLFKRPVNGRFTSKMGFRIDPFTKKLAYHAGIDIANRTGTPVTSAQFGRVVFVGYKGLYGKTVIIVHPQGYKTVYAHLEKITVKKGQAVKQGERIGLLGNTGRSTGPHLHFEVHQNGKLLDPTKVIKLR
jgi:murein DD-endopeptidase MepM/ murein hydrolase activator NlpD